MKREAKYSRPPFMPEGITQQIYNRWLHRKAVAHCRRDRKRGNHLATIEQYKIATHKAAVSSNGKDEYTGEYLNWILISKYDNVESSDRKRHYKAEFALLPTVDHVGDGLGEVDFKICGWRTNDAKNDMSYADFLNLCRKVINFAKQDRR